MTSREKLSAGGPKAFRFAVASGIVGIPTAFSGNVRAMQICHNGHPRTTGAPVVRGPSHLPDSALKEFQTLVHSLKL